MTSIRFGASPERTRAAILGRNLQCFGFVVATAVLFTPPAALGAQEKEPGDGGTPVRHISIGNYPRVDGLRLNFRDRDLELVRGVNVTIWTPRDEPYEGTVRGLALGLPMSGARNISGASVGAVGVGASENLHGLNIGGIGAGAGSTLSGISLGGVGVGAGGDVRGIAVGGVGVGAGGSLRGIAVGGIGAGTGGSARGALFGGIGVGAGGELRGVAVAGVGVGAGGDLTGVAVSGVGTGSGGDMTGLSIAGVGVGSGGTLRGVALAGVGVGAPRIVGGVSAPLVGADRMRGVVVAPILFRTERGGRLTGMSVSTVNAVRGHQHGLAIGIVNYAESLNGVQLGVINIVRQNPKAYRVLPVLNFGRAR